MREQNATAGEVTRLLKDWQRGDPNALDGLMDVAYDELRRMASSSLRRERAGHTLQSLDLVNEVYLRLLGSGRVALRDRAHFLAIAAVTMRRILVEHARRQQAEKRLTPDQKVTLSAANELGITPETDVLAVHQALEDLAQIHHRQAKLVELRFFGGMTIDEAAEVLKVSVNTVDRDWRVARLWLHQRLATAG